MPQPGLEAPVLGEAHERRVPDHSALSGGATDGPGAIVQVFLRVAPEVVEGLLVGIEEGWELLITTGQVEAPARVAQGEDEEVPHGPTRSEWNQGLPPVDLALQARRGLEPDGRPLGQGRGIPKQPDEPLHGLVTPRIAVLVRQFLNRIRAE